MLKLFGAKVFFQLPEYFTDDELKLDTLCVRALGSVLVMDGNANKGRVRGGGRAKSCTKTVGSKKGSRKQWGDALI
jgi:hypothetical protein